MACGAPIITVNIDPMTEYCQDSAEYFDGLNVDSIKNQISNIFHNKFNVGDMRSKSQNIANKYTWDTFNRNIIQQSYKLKKIY